MNDYIPDQIERGEASAERAFDELSQPSDMFKCYKCGDIFDPEAEGGTLSPDPYAMPVCGACFKRAFSDLDDHTTATVHPNVKFP